ncbi:hypothetical protein TRIATDRAFT_259643 [Trichoderma atroviride IMI 206040]|uniref:Uncharacterized protein n=1 Tax=Hypocrea atroviridis (strain ATCC 20476 / IMI 206040) TaxID=452589 RepID=G9P4K3_HYPAI|nr:uncharacterized protein TRIATDRAFT_259643 [Trichoderma atroviride IMI 206040]EHK41989.1 hypothetical protein TRIATDRAFT_259643 [Trichoderma atroviride IMI 206040]
MVLIYGLYNGHSILTSLPEQNYDTEVKRNQASLTKLPRFQFYIGISGIVSSH